jgi:hypothetical protein
MQGLDEWKADMLTLRGLVITRRRHERIPKRELVAEQRMLLRYCQKSAEAIVPGNLSIPVMECDYKKGRAECQDGEAIRKFMGRR